MSPLSVIITIAAYFAILFTVSYIAGRKADNAGFFVGNRKSSWYVVAFAMIGSSISGVTYVSVPGMVAASNFGYLQMVLGFIAGQLIIAFVLTPLFYRMNLVSIYEYLENRFGMSSYRTGLVFLHLQNAWSGSTAVPRLPDITTAGIRAIRITVYSECSHHRSFGMAVHFPWRRKVAHLDGLLENVLPCGIGCIVHLLYSFRP